MESADMAFLCNPDSPTARTLTKAAVVGIAEKAAAVGCTLVVDEAFIDFLPSRNPARSPARNIDQSVDQSVARNIDQSVDQNIDQSVDQNIDQNIDDNAGRNIYESLTPLAAESSRLIVLGSMTKFYALSGLRLGYAVAGIEIIDMLKNFKEPWTVNTMAQRAGVIALNDAVYVKETFKLLREEKRFVQQKLKELGVEFYPSKINFYLLKSDRAGEIRDGLFKRGILVRDCSNYPGLDGRFLRMAVRTHRENSVVFKSMGRILSTHSNLRS
jgi:threonine-phosphate decarboxylase